MVKSTSTISYGLLGLSAICYIVLAYFTPREQFGQLVLLFTVLFACYVYVINHNLRIWHGIGAAILLRLLFLFAVPALSDDYIRFIWDGKLLIAGLNPYLHLPEFFISDHATAVHGLTPSLYRQLNSPGLYATHPPLAQLVFMVTELISDGSMMGNIVAIRSIILIAEIGNILLLVRLLRRMAFSDKHVFLYALNPLVILELTGNLHLEALLIFPLLLSFLLLFRKRYFWAGSAFGAAIAVNLLSLLLLAFVVRKIGWKKFMIFGAAVLLTVLIASYPLLSQEVIQNILRNTNLYFQKMEFNASAYYLLRWLGFRLADQNLLQLLGPLLLILTVVATLALAAVAKLGSIRRMIGYMAAALTIYLFLATAVPPWYLSTLIALTTLSHFRYSIVWSGLAILSYSTYRTPGQSEELPLIALEYALVFLWLLAELYLYRQRQRLHNLKK